MQTLDMAALYYILVGIGFAVCLTGKYFKKLSMTMIIIFWESCLAITAAQLLPEIFEERQLLMICGLICIGVLTVWLEKLWIAVSSFLGTLFISSAFIFAAGRIEEEKVLFFAVFPAVIAFIVIWLRALEKYRLIIIMAFSGAYMAAIGLLMITMDIDLLNVWNGSEINGKIVWILILSILILGCLGCVVHILLWEMVCQKSGKCPKCRKTVNLSHMFCSECGAELKKRGKGGVIAARTVFVMILAASCMAGVQKYTEDLANSREVSKHQEEKQPQKETPAAKPREDISAAVKEPVSKKKDEEKALRDLIDASDSELITYQVSRDNQGKYYDNGVAGNEINQENVLKIALSKEKHSYKYFTGLAILNYDYAGSSAFDSYIKVFLDKKCKFTYHPDSADDSPEAFSLNLTGGETLEIVMYGANDLSLVNGKLTNEKEADTSDIPLGEEYGNPLENVEKISEDGGIHSLLYARDNLGQTYYRTLAGTYSDMVNKSTYNLAGEYSRFKGKAVLNFHYRNITTQVAYIKIYVDDIQRYCSPYIAEGMYPEEIDLDLQGAQTMSIEILGKNYARLVDVSLER